MHSVVRKVGVVIAAVVAVAVVAIAAFAGSAAAQAGGGDVADQSPRFLLASVSKLVPIDADRTPVLGRRLMLDLNGVTLKEALATIATRSGLELFYGDDQLALGRRVHLKAEGITVAAALTDLLFGAGVDVVFNARGGASLVARGTRRASPVGSIAGRVTDAKTGAALTGATVSLDGGSRSGATGNDGRYRIVGVVPGTYTVRARYIGYTPGTALVTVSPDEETTADFVLERSVQRLDDVVTTGTVVPTEVKALPTPISVVTGDELRQKGYEQIDQIFRGDIPGAIAWDLGARNYYSNIYVRGASSLGGSYIKTYIDGVEVANPTYLATIDPSSIDRIEVLRGPQGSTLYGSQALAGVMQVFTKKGRSATHPQFEAKVSGGLIESRWGNAGQQDHSLAISGGGQGFSYRVGGSLLQHDDWVPHTGATNASLYGSVQQTQGRLTTELSARYYSKSFGINSNPDFASLNPSLGLFDETDLVKQQTVGLTLKYAVTPHWQHVLVFGFDRTGYDYHLNTPRYTTPADSFLTIYSSDESKASLGYTTTVEASLGAGVQSALTAGVDHWEYGSGNYFAADIARTSDPANTTVSTSVSKFQYGNTGFFVQEQLGFRDALFITGGLRADDSPNFGASFGLAWAPRVGLSYVRAVGGVTAKARVAYGKAIRPPAPALASESVTSSAVQLANPNLGPEQQAGWDGGVDLYIGRRGSLEVSYYTQTVNDLASSVVLSLVPVYTYQFQNVGEIKNKGWELQGRFNAGRFGFTGTYSVTHSRVQKLSSSYTGDLQIGDEMLDVPEHTAGAAVSYAGPRTAVTLGATYIGSWTDYDYTRELTDIYVSGVFNPGRSYLKTYPGFAKLNLAISQTLSDRIGFFLRADNVTNNNVHELNDYQGLNKGRVTMAGLRVQF